jgi:FkbM family methyltransferase
MFLYNFAIADKISLCNMTSTYINTGSAYIHKLHDDSTDYSSDYQKSWRDNNDLLPKKENNIFVPSFNLDYIIEIFENVSVIKIDVEGFEIQVLKGAEKFLNKFKPAIEIFPCNFEKCNELLNLYGYKLIAYLGKEDYLYQYTS